MPYRVKSINKFLCVKPPRSLKSLDSDYSSKNHVRKFLCALPLKWRAKVTSIIKAKDLATLPLDELIVALKDKVTREQTSNDSDSQDGSDEDIDKEEAEAFNMLAKNFRKFFRALGTKVVKARSQRGLATITVYKATLLVSVESRKRTRLSLEEHGAIVKT
nr:hypothetical protein [Tanacetum cinerariifolium]